MFFKNREDAGKKLRPLLAKYQGTNPIVYAVPRGGIVIAEPIANYLHAPIDLLLAHKIGHPAQPEYAIAAVSESGQLVVGSHELQRVNKEWLQDKKEQQLQEMQLKRQKYLGKRKPLSVKDQIAIVVDDGIATGLTLQAGIKELRSQQPKKIVIAVPVAPRSTADFFKTLVEDFVAVEIPEDELFFGSIGAYYDNFSQVEDEQVMAILTKFHQDNAHA